MTTQAVEIVATEVLLPVAWSLNCSRVLSQPLRVLSAYEARFDMLPSLEFEFPGGPATLALLPGQRYGWEADTLRFPQSPVTAIEFLSPTQAFDAFIANIRHLYLANGVQSAWLMLPIVQHIFLFLPDQPPQAFTTGTLHDPATQVTVALDIFR